MLRFARQRLKSILTKRRYINATRWRYRPILERLEDWVLPSTFPVTSTADSGANTLRQAILNANNQAGTDLITFDILGTGVHTIQPTAPLPQITGVVTIDGTTQPGYSGTPLIEINGALVAGTVDGLDLTAGSSTLKGLAVNGFTGDGIAIFAGNGNTLTGNVLGTDPTGATAKPNGVSGLLIESANNTVGGTAAAARNILSGNSFSGIQIFGSTATGNVIAGNFIGTNAAGKAAIANASVGIIINGAASSNTIGGTAAGSLNLISGNTFIGVQIADSNTTGNLVVGNDIGTDNTGAKALANMSDGVLVNNAATSNTVGGVTAAARNIISGNAGVGVQVADPNTKNNVVAGNYVGTDVTGTLAVANSNDGVLVNNGATNNTIGGSAAGAGNLVSGNAQSGVQVADPGTSSNLVQGNFIGTDVTGTAALANQVVGVLVNNAATSNTIGTNGDGVNDAQERNIISANHNEGVIVADPGTNGNVVAGNFIGTDVTGTHALGNGTSTARAGIALFNGTQSNRIGASAADADPAGEANVVAASGGDGIFISDPGTSGIIVAGNRIGTDLGGTLTLGNTNNGVFIRNGAQLTQVGGSAVLANIIAFNGQDGVLVADNASTGNSIRANSLFSNGGLGIDLGPSGVQANHIGATVGPNNLQNYPVITTATPGASTSIAGTLNALASTTYTLDFYASPTHDVAYYGPGKRYLGSAMVSTDASGNTSFSVTIPASTSTGEWLTATATDSAGNTSEFAGDRQLPFASASLSTTTWTAIGPAPVAQSPAFTGPVMSGRTVFGLADPANSNVMFLEADGGGVWKTSDWLDPSPLWTPLTDTQPSGSTGYFTYHGMAVFPGSPEIIYALAQGPGGGVLKTTDGGTTWTLLGNSLFDQFELTSIAVDPTNANVLYVSALFGPAANSGGVYKSTNGGTTWTNMTSSIHAGTASDVVMDPTNSQVLYAGLIQNTTTPATNGIYKTVNGGTNWTLLSNGDLSGAAVGDGIRLAIAPSNHNVVYATIFDPALGNAPIGLPHRFLSSNGGTSWAQLGALPTPEDNRQGHVVLSVDPSNAAIVYVNGDHTLYQSVNSGATWTLLNNFEDPNAGFFDNAGKFILVGDHGIYLTGATASTLINKQGNLQTNEFYTVTINPNNPFLIYGIAQDQFAPVQYNGYPAWTALTPVSNTATDGTGETGKILAAPGNPGRLYQYTPANSGSFMFRSDDGGASWVDKGTGIDTSLAGFGLAYAAQKSFVMDPNNSSRLLVGTNKVYVSTNAGDTWTAISAVLSPSPNVADQYIVRLAISPSAPNTIYAATADGHVWVTITGGGSWAERDTGLPKDRFNPIGAIQVDPANANHAYIAATNDASFNSIFGPQHIWQTTNGGVNWTAVPLAIPSNLYITDLVVDWRSSPPTFYAGTARGVYRSINGGTNWSIFGAGLPNAEVADMQFLPSQNLLVIGTFGRGAFEILAPAGAPHFQVTAPASATAGGSFSITVTAQDGSNNTLTGYLGTVHFTSSDGSATLPANYMFTAADAGSHTFTGVILRTAGSQTITGTDTVTNSITGMANVTVNPSSSGVASFLVAGFTSPITAGTASSVTVTAKDGSGNTVTGYTGTVHFTSSDSQAGLPADYAFIAADNGAHTFSATLKTAGSQSITASDTLTLSITGSQTGITVNPAAVSTLAVSGFPSPETAGVAHSFTVTAKDTFNNTVTGYLGKVHLTSSDAQAVLPANYTFVSGDHGVHVFSATLKTAGTRALTATDTLTSSITGSQSGIIVNAAVTGKFSVTGFPSPVIAGVAGSFTITARDAFGNLTAGYLGTVHFSATGLSSLPANYTFVTGDNGVHSFSAALKTAGTQSLTANDTLTTSIKGSQTGIVVKAAATSQLGVSGFPSPSVAGTAGTFTVTAKDTFGNKTTGYLGTVHFTSSDALAVLPANYSFVAADNGVHTFSATLKTAGSKTITATDTVTNSITGKQTVTINGAVAVSLTVSGFTSPTTAGASHMVTVTAKDTFGNVATGYLGTITLASSDPLAALPANYTFVATDKGKHVFSAILKTAGSQSIIATDTVTASITGKQTGISVTAAAASTFKVTGFPSTITNGTPGNFTVIALDTFGNVATGYRGAVHFTSSDTQAVLPANYTFTSTDSGKHVFSATLKSMGTQSITATDTVTTSITGSETGINVTSVPLEELRQTPDDDFDDLPWILDRDTSDQRAALLADISARSFSDADDILGTVHTSPDTPNALASGRLATILFADPVELPGERDDSRGVIVALMAGWATIHRGQAPRRKSIVSRQYSFAGRTDC